MIKWIWEFRLEFHFLSSTRGRQKIDKMIEDQGFAFCCGKFLTASFYILKRDSLLAQFRPLRHLWPILWVQPVALIARSWFISVARDLLCRTGWFIPRPVAAEVVRCPQSQWVNGESRCVCVCYPRDEPVTYYYNDPVVTSACALAPLSLTQLILLLLIYMHAFNCKNH